jgi:DNA-3-methyladenine glycosylase II
MFLIFGLHHPDVWPLGDLGIQNGLKRLVRSDLTAGDMAELGERWQPHRSLAARYIWKSLDNTPVS